MPTSVTRIAPADRATALAHFESCLTLETDAWDVHEALCEEADFVLIDARGPDDYAQGHIPGAVNIPHGKIIESRMAKYAERTIFVVYCSGCHCNGAHRAAARLARLGRPVKLMIGGIDGWLKNGYALERAGV